MNCRHTKSRLSRYLDGEMSVTERERIESHVNACPACRKALEQLQSVSESLAQLPSPPDVPQGFAERLRSLAAQQAPVQQAILSFHDLLTRPMRFAAAAVLMLGLGLGAVLSLDLNRTGAAQKNQAATDPAAVYGLDVLTDAPGGSLADAYLALAGGANGGGE